MTGNSDITKDSTIAALATPPGVGGLSIIRISGPDAFDIVDSVFSTAKVNSLSEADPYSIHYGKITDKGELLDTVTVSVFKSPNSYTGENTAEIGSHGGNIVYRRVLDLLYRKGAQPAQPGEFTKRAFINGKMDLTQVEAVADLIHAESEDGARLAASQLSGSMRDKLISVNANLKRAAGLLELELDFSEEEAGFIDRDELDQLLGEAAEICTELAEGYRSADILRSGLHVAIVGLPNAGKSTLFNALLGEQRAITSDIAGTTRDYLKETIMLGGSAVHLYDTAGIRESDDTIEIEGIKLVESVMERSSIVAVLSDMSDQSSSKISYDLLESIRSRYHDKKVIFIGTKSDLVNNRTSSKQELDMVVSSVSGEGIEKFKNYLKDYLEDGLRTLGNTIVNQRQASLLKSASEFIINAKELNQNGEGNELIGYEIRDAAKEISWITGERWSEQVLNDVFAGFCIGK
jgi:tRNA modification GTPase